MEKERKSTITLADGTQLIDLELNGNCYISNVEVTKEQLADDNLVTVDVDGIVRNNVICTNLWESDGKWWFVIRERTTEELKELELNAKIEFLMAMQGVVE